MLWIINKSWHHKSRGFCLVVFWKYIMGKNLCTCSHANYVNDMNMCGVWWVNLNMWKIFNKNLHMPNTSLQSRVKLKRNHSLRELCVCLINLMIHFRKEKALVVFYDIWCCRRIYEFLKAKYKTPLRVIILNWVLTIYYNKYVIL